MKTRSEIVLACATALAVSGWGCGGKRPTEALDPSAQAAQGLGGNGQGQNQQGQNQDGQGGSNPPTFSSSNSFGTVKTISTAPLAEGDLLFGQSLGTNGRSCASCHAPDDGWTITPAQLSKRFDATDGQDPVFRPNDGANSPNADVSTKDARRNAYSMLLNKGLIRVGIGIPANAEFELVAVDDPYGYASASELSLFRRPLPSTNLGFLSTVMWDGRETFPGLTFAQDLADQSNGATLGHAQGTTPLTQQQRDQIVHFESALFTAQSQDNDAGDLTAAGASGGPQALSAQNYYAGINDVLGGDPTGAHFNSSSMTIYNSWAGLNGNSAQKNARRSIARGEALFNTRQFVVSGVRGLNDMLGQPRITATCTTCHDSPNVGNHSLPLPLDIGLTDASRRTPDMPLYTLRNKATGELYKTTDPGRALITGAWKDLSRFKGPTLRALASKAPYFHNGSASRLEDVIQFYQDRFSLALSSQEKADLTAFLRTL